MVIPPFSFSGVPHIIYGPGTFREIPRRLARYGNSVLVVTGGSSLKKSGRFDELRGLMKQASLSLHHVSVNREPSPDTVDDAVAEFGMAGVHAVLAVGGGSVIDAGKAISAMLPSGEPVLDYLEGAGPGKVHDGRKVPFLAVPTTAGTGSEATKNAVLSRVGPSGFKKSLRHENFVPDVAVIDPELTMECPREITASTGLDAFTQLLGSYVSTAASPVTDALALRGLDLAARCLPLLGTGEEESAGLRGGLALAALFSGITLANAGLDIVHGLASPIGGYFDIPHGVVCGTLAGEAARMNIRCLRERGDRAALGKYAAAGSLVSGIDARDTDACCDALAGTLDSWISMFGIPALGSYGITDGDLDKIVMSTANKNNPVALTPLQIRAILEKRL